jgi:hypothetical protein
MRIRNWALRHISGDALAQYFLSIADGSTSALASGVTAPWERNEHCVDLSASKVMA